MHDGTQEVDTPPEPLGQLIGHDEVVEQVAQLVFRPDVRLVTLTGRSGVGKTVVTTRCARVIGQEDGLDIPRVQVDRHGRRTGLDEVAAVVSMSADGPAGLAPSGRRRIVLLDGLEAARGRRGGVGRAGR